MDVPADLRRCQPTVNPAVVSRERKSEGHTSIATTPLTSIGFTAPLYLDCQFRKEGMDHIAPCSTLRISGNNSWATCTIFSFFLSFFFFFQKITENAKLWCASVFSRVNKHWVTKHHQGGDQSVSLLSSGTCHLGKQVKVGFIHSVSHTMIFPKCFSICQMLHDAGCSGYKIWFLFSWSLQLSREDGPKANEHRNQ